MVLQVTHLQDSADLMKLTGTASKMEQTSDKERSAEVEVVGYNSAQRKPVM